MLLADLVKEFKFDMQCKKLSPRTIKNVINITKAFIHYTEKEDLEKIIQLNIKEYVAYLQGLGRTETYINSILKFLRMFYKYCQQEEYIS